MRGPSAWSHIVAWNTAKDTFEHGAWFRGRIYEDRCAVSPDGELFLYFALKGSLWNTDYRGTWTAVSRLPWLHALALWPAGDTWGGGGWFADDRSVVLQTGTTEAHANHSAHGLSVSLGRRLHSTPSPTVPDAQWTGCDHSGATVFTREGKLFRSNGNHPSELADFNGLTPSPRPSPAWAQTPLNARKRSRRKRRKGRWA